MARSVLFIVAVLATALFLAGTAATAAGFSQIHTVTCFQGADSSECWDTNRWYQDLDSVKKAGFDGAWMVNVWYELQYGGSWTTIPTGAFNETRIAKLKQIVGYAKTLGLKMVICLAYCDPPYTLLLDDTQFQQYMDYITRIVTETGGYDNVRYVLAGELLVSVELYARAANHVELVNHFHDWCYSQNSNIGYWNSRWGTSFTWETILPAGWLDGNTARRADHYRWLNEILQPRLAALGTLIKGIAPDRLLGWHDFTNASTGYVTNPANSPLATTNKFDFVTTGWYGGGVYPT